MHEALWLVADVTEEALLFEGDGGLRVELPLDYGYSYFSAPKGGVPTFQHLAEIAFDENGSPTVTPVSPPRTAGATPPKLNPVIVRDGDGDRYFTWQERDPVHLVALEEPRQLLRFEDALCAELRRQTGCEPRFSVAKRLSGDPVYEISADYRARWLLLGGAGGRPGDMVLVLTDRRATASAPTHSEDGRALDNQASMEVARRRFDTQRVFEHKRAEIAERLSLDGLVQSSTFLSELEKAAWTTFGEFARDAATDLINLATIYFGRVDERAANWIRATFEGRVEILALDFGQELNRARSARSEVEQVGEIAEQIFRVREELEIRLGRLLLKAAGQQ